MSTRTKTFLINTLLIIFSLSIACAICEVTVRILYKNETVLFPRYHTDYQYGRYTIRGIRPNSEYWMTSIDGSWKYITNNRGFRNTKNFPYAKPANTIRVLSLGDSHTEGYEVRQDFTFSAVLERYLNYHSKNTEVINAGVSGFSNEEELAFLENEGIKYSPDVVVLGFYANDFDDNVRADLYGLDSQGKLTEKKYVYIPGVRIQNVIYSIPAVQWLSENSYFYSLLFNKTWEFFKYKSILKSETATSTTLQQAESAIPTSTTTTEYQIALTAALIERMQKVCADHGIRFIMVDIPNSSIPELYRYKPSVPSQLLEKLKRLHVEYISSDSLLQKFDGAAEMHAPHGHHHISEFTHTLIGVEIGQHLLATASRTVRW